MFLVMLSNRRQDALETLLVSGQGGAEDTSAVIIGAGSRMRAARAGNIVAAAQKGRGTGRVRGLRKAMVLVAATIFAARMEIDIQLPEGECQPISSLRLRRSKLICW